MGLGSSGTRQDSPSAVIGVTGRAPSRPENVRPRGRGQSRKCEIFFSSWSLPVGRTLRAVHFRRMPPTTSCMSTPLLLSIQAAMKSGPAQVLPV